MPKLSHKKKNIILEDTLTKKKKSFVEKTKNKKFYNKSQFRGGFKVFPTFYKMKDDVKNREIYTISMDFISSSPNSYGTFYELHVDEKKLRIEQWEREFKTTKPEKAKQIFPEITKILIFPINQQCKKIKTLTERSKLKLKEDNKDDYNNKWEFCQKYKKNNIALDPENGDFWIKKMTHHPFVLLNQENQKLIDSNKLYLDNGNDDFFSSILELIRNQNLCNNGPFLLDESIKVENITSPDTDGYYTVQGEKKEGLNLKTLMVTPFTFKNDLDISIEIDGLANQYIFEALKNIYYDKITEYKKDSYSELSYFNEFIQDIIKVVVGIEEIIISSDFSFKIKFDKKKSLGFILKSEKHRPQNRSPGALIQYVIPNSTAIKKGLKPGNEIIEVDQIEIKDSIAFETALRNLEADEITLKIRGKKKKVKLNIINEELDSSIFQSLDLRIIRDPFIFLYCCNVAAKKKPKVPPSFKIERSTSIEVLQNKMKNAIVEYNRERKVITDLIKAGKYEKIISEENYKSLL